MSSRHAPRDGVVPRIFQHYTVLMKQTIHAIYENGLLRPLEPLNIPDQERVSVTVECGAGDEWLDHDAMELARREGDPAISLEDVRRRLSVIQGNLSDVITAERGDY